MFSASSNRVNFSTDDPCATATDFMVAVGLLHLSNPINGHNSNLFIRGWAFKHFELLETGMKWLSLT
jgi:hypothetical protein